MLATPTLLWLLEIFVTKSCWNKRFPNTLLILWYTLMHWPMSVIRSRSLWTTLIEHMLKSQSLFWSLVGPDSYSHLKRFVYVITDEVYGDSADNSCTKTELDHINLHTLHQKLLLNISGCELKILQPSICSGSNVQCVWSPSESLCSNTQIYRVSL